MRRRGIPKRAQARHVGERGVADHYVFRLNPLPFPSPDRPVLGIHDLAGRLEMTLGEHPRGGICLLEGVGTDETNLRVGERERHKRVSGLGRIALALLVRRHAVGDFDDPIGSRRPFETARPDNGVGFAIHDGKPERPEICGC